MTRTSLASALLVAASLCTVQSAFASPVVVASPLHAFAGAKTDMIKFSVRNDSAAEVRIKAADNEFTIAPGKTADMKLPNGTQLIAMQGTSHEAGSVLATVSSALKGNTLVVR